jgi:hypothetical protein
MNRAVVIAAVALLALAGPAMAQKQIPGMPGRYDCRVVSRGEVVELADRLQAMHNQDAQVIDITDMRAFPDGLFCRATMTTTYVKAGMTYTLKMDAGGRMMIETEYFKFVPPTYPFGIYKTPQTCRGNLEGGNLRECTDDDLGVMGYSQPMVAKVQPTPSAAAPPPMWQQLFGDEMRKR